MNFGREPENWQEVSQQREQWVSGPRAWRNWFPARATGPGGGAGGECKQGRRPETQRTDHAKPVEHREKSVFDAECVKKSLEAEWCTRGFCILKTWEWMNSNG